MSMSVFHLKTDRIAVLLMKQNYRILDFFQYRSYILDYKFR